MFSIEQCMYGDVFRLGSFNSGGGGGGEMEY